MTERSADYLRFSKVVGPATRLVVAGGYSAFDPAKRSRNEVLAETESASTIEAIVEALGFQDEGRMDWMTPGQPTLVFIRDREVLASVRCLLPGYVRCEGVWEGDVKLLDDGQLQELLIGFAAGSVHAGLEARLELGEVARSIRHRFGLSPMSTYRALREAGQPSVESKVAVDETLSVEERTITETALDEGETVLRELDQ